MGLCKLGRCVASPILHIYTSMCICVSLSVCVGEHVTWQADSSNRTAAIDRSVLLGAIRSMSNSGVSERDLF